ncbi:MAG: hemolysin D [Nitrospirae bacterium CG18_big_fil_WC_8_21_14_2_50_70_55]|nr:hemolysin III family protein [Deltaproteobacteria bacterium]OIP63010.1 MAG: hemolysin D [Nitrospirae bacterium CG2_30_70_394]PIQ05330.1 MAG: hemolysin D [Nitrospirae bacterium CG18_big_fil_WC_8_21_14_2_50_70_55]PIU79663.1 MAG: hemolysin D [Nitrospirae bacterium CG06_land_8_20_14_3_00_70_43]PIW82838.1 MAG: hemolysin D [Nitrospirae bacterium CG_4_8_14_3_um_filter_70_85]PIX83160.1 MAG: hemolysin D [Nitrospirae bacterium CG_4_10_14_3_um_filter_70_108]PJB95652.1 MAG: hemolysin D [Nitrospirae ba
MATPSVPHAPTPSLGEELANAISHGLGLVAALVAGALLVTAAAAHGGATRVVSVAVFAATMVLLYLTSTLYHGLPRGRAKALFRRFDHCAIFLLIAGTYTPFTLSVVRGYLGWVLFGVVWGLAAIGISLKAIAGAHRFPRLSLALYLAMGWLIVGAARPVWLHLPPWGLFWLAAGGLAYTAGIAFYAAPRLAYGHFMWHLFVLAGTTCHVVSVWRCVA